MWIRWKYRIIFFWQFWYMDQEGTTSLPLDTSILFSMCQKWAKTCHWIPFLGQVQHMVIKKKSLWVDPKQAGTILIKSNRVRPIWVQILFILIFIIQSKYFFKLFQPTHLDDFKDLILGGAIKVRRVLRCTSLVKERGAPCDLTVSC